MWICQKCNRQNTGKFCVNCGVAVNVQSASDLPPTVIGFQPPILPNQFQPQNQPQFQPQQQFQPNQPMHVPPPQQQFAPQPQLVQPQPLPLQPAKSGGKWLFIGGILLLAVFAFGGGIVWLKVIKPQREKEDSARKERVNEGAAKLMSADSILPEKFITPSSLEYNLTEKITKYQLLEASEKLPAELKKSLVNINDAVAGEYTNESNKVVLQILKYNTPEQAYNECRAIYTQITKSGDSSLKVTKNDSEPGKPSYCFMSIEGKNNQKTTVMSLYGFLTIGIGTKDNAHLPNNKVYTTLTR